MTQLKIKEAMYLQLSCYIDVSSVSRRWRIWRFKSLDLCKKHSTFMKLYCCTWLLFQECFSSSSLILFPPWPSKHIPVTHSNKAFTIQWRSWYPLQHGCLLLTHYIFVFLIIIISGPIKSAFISCIFNLTYCCKEILFSDGEQEIRVKRQCLQTNKPLPLED